MDNHRHLLILAAPRSGTTYAHQYLGAMGYDIGHERIGADGACGWVYVLQEEQYFGPNGKRDEYQWGRIVHQVRSPWDAIPSMTTHNVSMREWVCRRVSRIPMAPPEPVLRWAMWFWICWNQIIEAQTWTRYCVEDLTPGSEAETLLLGMLPWRKGKGDLPRTNCNTRTYDRITPAQMRKCDPKAYEIIKAMGERYGYAMPKGKED